MRKHTFVVAAVVMAVASLMLTVTAWADDEDPPGRVARLNFAEGSVSFQPGGEGDWLTAVRNRPLTTGDNLWTDRGSRAELHVGSTALRLGPETSLALLDLDDRAIQLRLAQGSLLLRVRHIDDEDTYEVDTPNLAFTILRPGEYRIDVNGNGDETTITDWHGQGEVTGGGYSYRVLAGQRAHFFGVDQLRHEIDPLPGDDDFDGWAFDRDRHEDRVESQNYISSEVTGYEDLDDYGHWHYVADYGNVWFPGGVAEGWAPYRYGHWAWIYPWGWTWVEDEPWGFAPFHYGRWAYVPGGWCWVPGPVVVRPVYAPALVAFVGGGVLAVGGGPGVAWFPLGPREVWVPPYRVSRTYVNNVNITNTNVNVTNVTNVYNNYTANKTTNVTYINQHVTNAVTVVSHDTFVNARPVARNVVQVNPKQIAEAPVTHAAPVQPVRASALGSGAPTQTRPPAAILNRQVVATRAPAPVSAPFEQRVARAQAPNVRVEGQGQPAQEPRNVARPPAPSNRGPEVRPEPARPPAEKPAPVETPNVPRPPESNRTEEPAARPAQPTPRPETSYPAAHPEPREAPRPPQPERAMPPNPAPRPPHAVEQPQQSWSHPLARPAPPVQEHNPQHAQQEEQKFHSWEQQKQAPQAPPHR